MIKRVCIFCGSSCGTKPAYAGAAATVGQLLVCRGVSIVYGGGSVGLMGVLADAVLAAGGDITGVIPQSLFDKELGHSGDCKIFCVKG